MAYSSEVVRKAQQRLAQNKADRESQILQRMQEAYVKVPRIRQIDMQLRSSITQAAQVAFTQGTDARQAMEQVKEQNLKLQKERQELAIANFPAGYLDETPICDRCGGELIMRADDVPETIRERLSVYHSQTEPLIDFYKEKGLLVNVSGGNSVESTTQAVLEALGVTK